MRLLTLSRDLTRRKAREREALFVAEGVRAVAELLDSSLDVVGMLCGPQLAGTERGRALVAAAQGKGIEISEVSEREFASAAGTDSPQGVLAVGRIPERTLEPLRARPKLRLVVLDSVQDPGNVGTIVRTAMALGADATLALPGTVDVWNAKVVRSAMGAVFHHHAMTASWEELRLFLESEGIELWAADRGGDSPASLSAPSRLAVALGNEGSGLSEPIRASATRTVTIPMNPAAESLNVAVAAGILLAGLRG
jgi:RNA methyltransferase, TrmH family